MLQKLNLSLLSKISILCSTLAIVLWRPFVSHWFNIYGYSLLLLAVLLSAHWIFRRELSTIKKMRTWIYIISIILGLISILQIAYWFLFFRLGQTNPQLGLLREMLRPSFERYGFNLFSALLILWFFLLVRLLTRVPTTARINQKE